MNSNKQLINLAGILVVVILLVAGVALIALPMYSQSQTIDGQTRTVAQTNSVYEQQIVRLSAAEARIDEIDADLADLRTEIAVAPELDDVHTLISAAAKAIDARVDSVSVDPTEPWMPRDALDDEGKPVAESSASTGTETGDVADPNEAGAAAPEPAPAATSDSAPQRQVLVTVTIDLAQPFASLGEGEAGDTTIADDTNVDLAALDALADRATRFVDALRAGPRLITPINVAYSDGKVTVSALTYFQTEGS